MGRQKQLRLQFATRGESGEIAPEATVRIRALLAEESPEILVAELLPTDKDHTEIIKNADYAMYKAKNGGRNRVIVYPSDEDQV